MHHELNEKAKSALDKKASIGQDIDINQFQSSDSHHEYVNDLSRLPYEDANKLLNVGVDIKPNSISTFIQKDHSIIHCHSKQEGVEMISIKDAMTQYDWLQDYVWKNVAVDTDKYTARVHLNEYEGYFIRTMPGVKMDAPLQSCLYISKEKFAQHVHNLVIAEPDSELKIITGCATAPHLNSGLHIGVSEFYVKKGAKLIYTMIHDWGKQVDVRPRTVVHVEEGGVYISNYISLKPVGSLQMYPSVYLDGPGARARLNSVIVAGEGSHLDIGSRVFLNAEKTRAEIISRGITLGGTIIARGNLIGKVAGVRAHLECKGLLLKNGLMHAIPEIEGYVPGVELSHEAAVGKINPEEIEYLMARGMDEETAISTIVRGFLNVDIEGLPAHLQQQIDKAISEADKDMI